MKKTPLGPTSNPAAVLTPRQVALRLHCCREHVLGLVRAGRLPGLNIGLATRPVWRVPLVSFEQFLNTPGHGAEQNK